MPRLTLTPKDARQILHQSPEEHQFLYWVWCVKVDKDPRVIKYQKQHPGGCNPVEFIDLKVEVRNELLAGDRRALKREWKRSRKQEKSRTDPYAGVPKKCPECGADVLGPDCETTKKGESADFWCSRAMEGCNWEMCFLDGKEV